MLYISSNFFVGKQICFLCRPHGFNIFGQQTISVWKDSQMVIVILEYEFIVVYKPGKIHVVVDVLFRLLNSSKPLGVLDQTLDASLFSIQLIWM
jgi:hypothetical protein